MESSLPSRDFYVVNYPAIVQNDDRAIQTLGGIAGISKTFSSSTRRLKLTFRPEMLLSKPVFGDPSPSTALVVRARRLRNKRTGEEKVQAEILGIIPRTYSFNALMDFQYGPFEKIPPEQCSSFGKSDQFRVFYDKLLVREPTRSLDLHLNNDVPLCVPPILFTRLDQPLTYCFSSRFRTNEYIELDSHNHNHPYLTFSPTITRYTS
uniref:General transcription factor 3C polypeptide 5 n=1 Tax=Schistocephalus solidus TaxID=70667 RepID=A0A0V0JBS5_SCHSO